MIKRRKTFQIAVGSAKIGSRHKIAVQTMTKVATTDVQKCLKQINQLVNAGADLVRIAVPTAADTAAFAKIVQKSPIPLIADIHFSPARAIEAIEAGAAKIRLNPGNIRLLADINSIIDCAKAHKIAIRVGINEASIRDLKSADVPLAKRNAHMLKEMKSYVRIFEKRGFDNIVLSVKSVSPIRTIETNRLVAEKFDYPIHLGLTHAGLVEDAIIPSSATLGALLAQGIGDTIRVSLAGDPAKEVEIANQILESLDLKESNTPKLIVCPTCGRCQVDVVKLARKVRKVLTDIDTPIKLAVMGCVVNGPGEAKDADIAVCAGKGKAVIYIAGKKVATVPEEKILPALEKELKKLTK